jgi:hypothetical protein
MVLGSDQGHLYLHLHYIYSCFTTGKEQIDHLTDRSVPPEFKQELIDMDNDFDERIVVDTIRAYHLGPKILLEIEIVMHASTLLYESHALGMDLQYEIEGREEVERYFVRIDYQAQPYDAHVVSKVLKSIYPNNPLSNRCDAHKVYLLDANLEINLRFLVFQQLKLQSDFSNNDMASPKVLISSGALILSFFAHRSNIVTTSSVDVSCARFNRRMAKTCKDDFTFLLSKYAALNSLTVV